MDQDDEAMLVLSDQDDAEADARDFALMVEQRRQDDERRRIEDEKRLAIKLRIDRRNARKVLSEALVTWVAEPGTLFARGQANSQPGLVNVCYVNSAFTAVAASPQIATAASASLAAAGGSMLLKAVALGITAVGTRSADASQRYQRALVASLDGLFAPFGVRFLPGMQFDTLVVLQAIFSQLGLAPSQLTKRSTCTSCHRMHTVIGDNPNLKLSIFSLRTDVPSLAVGITASESRRLRCENGACEAPLHPDGHMHTEETEITYLSTIIAFAFTGAGHVLARETDVGQQRFYQAPQRLVRRAISLRIGNADVIYRLVACCYRESASGSYEHGHWFTRSRRHHDVSVPTANEGPERLVAAGQWLTFDDAAPPTNVDWPLVRTMRPSILLYEQDNSADALAELALDIVDEVLPPVQQMQFKHHPSLAILNEPIFFRGGNPKNFTQALLDADHDVIHYLRRRLIEDNPSESTFVYNSQWVLRREGGSSRAEGTILCGQCQLGKTTVREGLASCCAINGLQDTFHIWF